MPLAALQTAFAGIDHQKLPKVLWLGKQNSPSPSELASDKLQAAAPLHMVEDATASTGAAARQAQTTDGSPADVGPVQAILQAVDLGAAPDAPVPVPPPAAPRAPTMPPSVLLRDSPADSAPPLPKPPQAPPKLASAVPHKSTDQSPPAAAPLARSRLPVMDVQTVSSLVQQERMEVSSVSGTRTAVAVAAAVLAFVIILASSAFYMGWLPVGHGRQQPEPAEDESQVSTSRSYAAALALALSM